MNFKKFAIAGLLAGLTLSAVGWVQTGRVDSVSAGPAVAELQPQLGPDGLYPTHGLLPYDQVIDIWTKKSDASPADYISRARLGSALTASAAESADLEQYEASEMVLRQALAINGDYVPAQLALASALHSQHNFDEARAIADSIIDVDVESLGAIVLAGDASFELGDYDRARDAYELVLIRERSAPVVSRLARLAWIDGDNARATELAQEALALSSRLALRPHQAAFYWFQLGHFRFVSGDIDGATSDLRQALLIAPDHPGALEKLAFVLASAGETDEALEYYERLIASGPAPDLYGLYADLLAEAGDVKEAARQNRLGLDLAAETADRFPAERRHLVSFYLTREPTKALELAAADFAERQDVGAYDTLAWTQFHNGQIDEAHRTITAGLRFGTRDAAMLYHAAEIAAAAGDLPAAAAYIEDALALNPNFHPTERDSAAALSDRLAESS